MKIVTHYDPKPIPTRQFDWTAVDDDTYDGAEDSHCPIGYGRTEQEAVAELLEKMEIYCRDRGAAVDGQMGACVECGAESGIVCRGARP